MADRTASEHALRKASERLDRSRLALLDQMRQVRGFEQGDSAQDARARMGQGPSHHPVWQMLMQAWQDHPAYWVLQTARPLFGAYAKSHPWQWVAVSALAGVTLVLLRPWRRVSASALLTTAVRARPRSRLLALWRAQIRTQASRQTGQTPGGG